MPLYLMSCRSRQLLGFLELGKTDANSVTMYWSAPLLLIVWFVKGGIHYTSFATLKI